MQDISKRITSNKTKHLLVENELKKLQKFDSSYFRGKSHFEEDGAQNYLAFQPMYRYFKRIAGSGRILDSEIVVTPLCLGNILKDFSVDNMKKTGLNEDVYDYSVDYDAIAVDDILNIHKYLIEKKYII